MRRIPFLICFACMALFGCKHDEHKTQEQSRFLATQALSRDTTLYREYVCQIRSIQHIELRSLEKGYLQYVYVDEGQKVKQGDRLFQIMPLIYKAEMQKAQAEVNYCEIEYRNTKTLADSNIVSSNELALVKAKLDRAKAELELAAAHLDFTLIRAPFDGIVGRFHEVRLGSLLEEGELLTTLSDNSKMWAYFNVPEAEYLHYATSRESEKPVQVKLQMPNNEFFPHVGRIETIEADFNNETGNIAFRATFPNPDRLLRHGETGNIFMPVQIKNALLIPQKATWEVLDQKYVFVIDKEGILKATPVETGFEMSHLYVVTKGLQESDRILLDGLRKVREKDKIRYDWIDPERAIGQLDLYAE